jgi:hypothetical protein
MENLAQLLKDELKEVRKDIRELRQEVTKYKGFVGGVLWTAAALFAAFQFIVRWLGGQNL